MGVLTKSSPTLSELKDTESDVLGNLCGGGDDVKGAGGRDEIENPGGRDEVMGSGGRDEIENPGGGDEIKNSGGGDEVENPGGRDEVEGPGGGDEVEGPGGRDEFENPGGADEVEDPGGSDEVEDPGGSDEVEVLGSDSPSFLTVVLVAHLPIFGPKGLLSLSTCSQIGHSSTVMFSSKWHHRCAALSFTSFNSFIKLCCFSAGTLFERSILSTHCLQRTGE